MLLPQFVLAFLAFGSLEAKEWSNFPFIVSIAHNNEHICTGTLLNIETIITAASCVSNKPPNELQINVINDLFSPKVSEILLHENYAHLCPYDNDLAIIKLEYNLVAKVLERISQTIFPENLPQIEKVQYEDLAIVNKAKNRDFLSYRLIQFEPSGKGCIANYHYGCGSYVSPQSCPLDGNEDLGAPVMRQNSNILVGIASLNPERNCSVGLVKGFLKLEPFQNWIEKHLSTSLATSVKNGVKNIGRELKEGVKNVVDSFRLW